MPAPQHALGFLRSPLVARAAVVGTQLPVFTVVMLTAASTTDLPALGLAGFTGALASVVPALSLMIYAVKMRRRLGKVGRCRGAGLLGVSALVGGLGAAAIALDLEPPFICVFLIASQGTLALGLTQLPAAAASPVGRLRLILDGLGAGLSLLLTTWLLVLSRPLDPPAGSIWAAVTMCTALAVTLISTMRAWRQRRAVAACSGGAALSAIGLGGLGLSTEVPLGNVWPLAFGFLLSIGPVIMWHSARRVDLAVVTPDPVNADGTLAGRPALAVPAGMALVTAASVFYTGGEWDQLSVLLAILAVGVVVARETMGSRDIARYVRQISARENAFRGLVAGSTDVIVLLDADLIVRWQSPAAARQFGLSDQDVVGRPFTALLRPEDVPMVEQKLRAALQTTEPIGLLEARLQDGFGQWRDTESTVGDRRVIPDVGGVVLHVRDVGERKELERTVRRLGVTDPVTGLANRSQALRILDGWPTVPTSQGAVLLIGLDGLATVNVLHGPDLGDAMLVEAARRVRFCVSEQDLAARWSGNELLVITRSSPVRAYALAARVLNTLAQPYDIPGSCTQVAAHVGLADLAGAPQAGEALRQAGIALRRACQPGANGVEWYDEVMEAALLRRLSLERELLGAIPRGELDVAFQPVVDLTSDRPVAVEALARWRHPRCGTVPPEEFIPVAEDLGVISEVGEWVLRRACRQLGLWRGEGYQLAVTVNVSTTEVVGPDFVATVRDALAEYECEADWLVLEIAEPSVLTDPPFMAQLRELRGLGVRIALDRFGAGQVAMAHLQRMPIDLLKLDRAFLAERAPGRTTPMIDVMVGLGRRLGFEIIACGVESEQDLAVVRAAGCRYAQGFALSRPAPAERVEAYCRESTGSRPDWL